MPVSRYTPHMKILILLITLPLLLLSTSIRTKNFGNAEVNEVTSIYDGDTFRATIKGWPEIVGERIGIRISGIDTPEIRGKCAKEKALAYRAKEHTVSLLRGAKKVELRNMFRGKYFRIVADVIADGTSVGQSLIESGLAVEYDGGTKTKDWCR